MEVNNLKICVMANVIHLVNVHDQLLAYIFPTTNFKFHYKFFTHQKLFQTKHLTKNNQLTQTFLRLSQI